jgi:hypothetical protein
LLAGRQPGSNWTCPNEASERTSIRRFRAYQENLEGIVFLRSSRGCDRPCTCHLPARHRLDFSFRMLLTIAIVVVALTVPQVLSTTGRCCSGLVGASSSSVNSATLNTVN